MRIFLKKDIEKVGIAGEVIKVEDGFARNYLIPRNFAVEITSENEDFFSKLKKEVENRKEKISSTQSILAERIKSLKLTLKKKMHDDGKLYGAVNSSEIVELLAHHSISISKSQVIISKSIKTKGMHEVTIKLTNRLQPTVKIQVMPE